MQGALIVPVKTGRLTGCDSIKQPENEPRKII